MTDQIAVLVLENAYFYSGENSFTGAGALSSKFTGTKCVFSVAVKRRISHLGVVVRRTLRHVLLLAYITQS